MEDKDFDSFIRIWDKKKGEDGWINNIAEMLTQAMCLRQDKRTIQPSNDDEVFFIQALQQIYKDGDKSIHISRIAFQVFDQAIKVMGQSSYTMRHKRDFVLRDQLVNVRNALKKKNTAMQSILYDTQPTALPLSEDKFKQRYSSFYNKKNTDLTHYENIAKHLAYYFTTDSDNHEWLAQRYNDSMPIKLIQQLYLYIHNPSEIFLEGLNIEKMIYTITLAKEILKNNRNDPSLDPDTKTRSLDGEVTLQQFANRLEEVQQQARIKLEAAEVRKAKAPTVASRLDQENEIPGTSVMEGAKALIRKQAANQSKAGTSSTPDKTSTTSPGQGGRG